jgi:hypothetical protein
VRKLFAKADRPPADVVARLPAEERVVSWADVVGGSVLLASPCGLWWPEPDGPRLIGWQHVSKAIWHGRVLTVIQADVVDDLLLVERDPVSVELEVPRDLPPVVRKRVEHNVVRSELQSIVGGTARFVARRVPGEDGLRWWARLEAGTPDTAQVRSAVSARLAILQAEYASRDDPA